MWKAKIESPVGELQVFASENGLCGLLWPGVELSRFGDDIKSAEIASHPVFNALSLQLDEYFSGTRREFDLPLDLIGTKFQVEAWNALQEIPFGETRTYAQQAAAIGRPKAIRAIGAANGRNPISIVVPCHRVIGKNGSLTGFAGGINVKRTLLDLEQKRPASRLF